MTCRNCGAEIPDNSRFCQKCGAEIEKTTEPSLKDEKILSRAKKLTKILIIAVIAAVLLIGAELITIAVINTNSPERQVERGMTLADKYMVQQNYGKATMEYIKVINVNPMNENAYLGLANAYLGIDDKDKAIDTLETGFEKTCNDKIKKKLDELRKNNQNSSSNSTESVSAQNNK